MNVTNITNIEKAMWRHKNKNITKVPKNLNQLRECMQNEEEWKKRLIIDEKDAFFVENIYNNNKTEAIIFIDKCLTNSISDVSKETVFFDGTFKTVQKIEERNTQLWTILIRHNDRVSKILLSSVILLI